MQRIQKLLEERDRFEALADLLDRKAMECPLENELDLLRLASIMRGVAITLKWSAGNQYSADLDALLREAGVHIPPADLSSDQ